MDGQLREKENVTAPSGGNNIWFAVAFFGIALVYFLSIRELKNSVYPKSEVSVIRDTVYVTKYKVNNRKVKELKWELSNSEAEVIAWRDEAQRLDKMNSGLAEELNSCYENIRQLKIKNTQYVEQN